MRTYLVTVHDDFNKVSLTGKFEGLDETFAASEAQLYYAYELDCEPQDVKVIDVKEVR